MDIGSEFISAAVPLVLGVGVGLLMTLPPLELIIMLASIALLAISIPQSGIEGLMIGVTAALLVIDMAFVGSIKLSVVSAGVTVLLAESMLDNKAIKVALMAALMIAAVLSTQLIVNLQDVEFMVSMMAATYVSAMLAWRRGTAVTGRTGYVVLASMALLAVAVILSLADKIPPSAVIAASSPVAVGATRSRLLAVKAGGPIAAVVAAAFLGVAPYVIIVQATSLFGFRREVYRKGLEPPLAWLHAWLNGRYFIDSIVATGGFSYVLRGSDDRGSIYAIKVLKEKDSRGNPLASNPSIIQSFKREMSNYLLIDSPRIVKVYEVHIPPDEELPYGSLDQYMRDPPYIVMEYMRGGSLRQYLRERGRLDVEETVRIAREIALALQELHASGRLHLDLKPENILFGDKDRRSVKIGDLGASKIATGGYLLVSQFSASYAAPEVLRGRQATDRSDIYSLGLIIYEMLTGVNPQAYRLSNVPPPAIDLNSLGVPPSISMLITRCLDPSPINRPGIIEVVGLLGN